jgi:glycosyltransferase involved in cell wall biosynthesis
METPAPKLPALSVVVPNYNHARHLPRCLAALLGQSLPPQEILVVDDGSTDDSMEVLRRLAEQHPTIRLLRNDQNRGVTYTVSRGVDEATGDFVFLHAADDEVLPGFFEKTMGLLAQHPKAGLACTAGDWRERHTGLHWHMGLGMTDRPAYITPQEAVRLEQRGRFFIPGHTAVYRRDALIEAGKLIEELRHYSDWFSTTVVAFRYGACVVPEPLAIFNIEPNTYYQRSRRSREINEAAIEHVLKLLHQPEYADVADSFRRSGALYICGPATLRVLLRRPQYRGFMTARYLRKTLWHATRIELKRRAPAFLVNWYAGIAGYRKRDV